MEKGILVLLIGGNKGIGYELIKQLLQNYPKKISTFLFTVRSTDKGESALKVLKKFALKSEKNSSTEFKFYILDVLESSHILNVSSTLKKEGHKIDLFIHNAGIFIRGDTLLLPVIKKTINVNFFGPKNVFENLSKSNVFAENCRLVFVSSGLGMFSRIKRNPEVHDRLLSYQENGFSEDIILQTIDEYFKEIEDKVLYKKWPRSVYAVSKLLLTIYVNVLSRKFKNYHFSSVCPGWCQTDLTKGTNAPKTAEEGAQDILKGMIQFDEPRYSGLFVSSGRLWNIKNSHEIKE